MEAREANRLMNIRSKREEKDSVLEKTQSEKSWQMMIKREQDLIKREDRSENVERITKANEYKKQKILEKIEYDNMKSTAL